MGMQIFESSGAFSPADWGLAVGDMIQAIVVGGGSSGECRPQGEGGNKVSGNASSFGSYVTAEGGSANSVNGMGAGGTGYSVSGGISAGGGAGGYLPGIPIYGGNGGRGSTSSESTELNAPSGLGGIGDASLVIGSSYANNSTSIGNKGATGYGGQAGGGNGYGAGASGAGGGGTDRTSYSGGNSGAIAFGTVKLQNTTDIPVTVGSGGETTVLVGLMEL